MHKHHTRAGGQATAARYVLYNTGFNVKGFVQWRLLSCGLQQVTVSNGICSCTAAHTAGKSYLTLTKSK
jgi:hypothetical protein